MALFLILAPFATFATLMMLSTVTISLAAAALVSLTLVGRDLYLGRSLKMLAAGGAALFAALLGYHAVAAAELAPGTVRLVVDGGLLVIALASIALRKPFTLQYAREAVDAETSRKPVFLRTNYVLSGVWSIAFLLMLAADAVALVVPGLPLWTFAAITFAARNSATCFTQWYPKRVRAALAAAATT
jgi:hypothetical protein